jgi:hypothetical protein
MQKDMPKKYKFSESDVRLLQAIIWACNAEKKEEVDLKTVISYGDALNHAIFTWEEITVGIPKLKVGGYLVQRGSIFRPSEKAIKLYKAYDNNLSPHQNASSWLKQMNGEDVGEGAGELGFSKQFFEEAVNAYSNARKS